MSPDDSNAIGMILLFLATLGTIAISTRPLHPMLRFLIALPAAIVTFVNLNRYDLKCEVTGLPFYQSLLTSVCIFSIILMIRKRLIAVASCIVVLVTGYQLSHQYTDLVNRAGSYAYIDGMSNYAYNYACPEPWSIPVTEGKSLWHSAFTGIYRAEYKREKSAQGEIRKK